MHRYAIALAALAMLAGCYPAATAGSRTHFGFSIGITNAPPPPRIVYIREPDVMVVPGSSVYLVRDSDYDYDMFRFGSYWYVCNDGYWYRSRNSRGSFVAVDVRSVPTQVLTVPHRYWKRHPHGGPPGLSKKQRASRY